jgi:hypothetical protein
VLANADNADSIASFFKAKGSVVRVSFPERVFLSRYFLNWRRERVEMLPKTTMRSADHGKS